MRDLWWFGRSVGGWASGFVALCGSRVSQFRFLYPSCFRTAVVVQGGWVDRFVGYVFFFFPSRSAGPALAGTSIILNGKW